MSAPRPAPSLASELAKPLSALERAIGGSPRPRRYPHPVNEIDIKAAMAVWSLLAYVMGQAHAPSPHVVTKWAAPKRALARLWGERELARSVIGEDGCPSRATPDCLQHYVDKWESALSDNAEEAARDTVGDAEGSA